MEKINKKLEEMTNEELWKLFPIIIKEHSSQYPVWYQQEAERIRRIAGVGQIQRMNHIGSTAVEGLVAKPTVDILLEVNRDTDMGQLKGALKQDGWILMSESNQPELRIVFNKGYTESGFADKVFHLHVRYPGDHGELYFRDYLRAHPDDAARYGDLKLELKKKYEFNRDAYTEAKTGIVNEYTKKARKEFLGKYVL